MSSNFFLGLAIFGLLKIRKKEKKEMWFGAGGLYLVI